MILAEQYGWPLFTVLPDILPPFFSGLEAELWALRKSELKEASNGNR